MLYRFEIVFNHTEQKEVITDKIRPNTESKNMVFIIGEIQVKVVIDTDITTKHAGTNCLLLVIDFD